MRFIYLFFVFAFVLSSCDSKHDCPACMGKGSVTVFGDTQVCAACNGKKKLTDDEYKSVIMMLESIRQGNHQGRNRNQAKRMETCPFCNGSGTSAGVGSTCGFCNGAGRVSSESAMQGRHVMQGGSVKDFYPSQPSSRSEYGSSSNSSRVKSRICPSCNGSTRCPVCGGTGETSNYGSSPRPCSYCYADGRCPKCMGKGVIPD